jgi:hypothetical protein
LADQLPLLPPDHSHDGHPYYRGETDPAVLAAWQKRYEKRMTGYALPLHPGLGPQKRKRR